MRNRDALRVQKEVIAGEILDYMDNHKRATSLRELVEYLADFQDELFRIEESIRDFIYRPEGDE